MKSLTKYFLPALLVFLFNFSAMGGPTTKSNVKLSARKLLTAPKTFYQGGYYTWLKSSSTDWNDDYADLVQALKENNWNFYGYGAMDSVYVEGAGGADSRFVQLLKATEGQGINIFGVLSEKHFFKNDYCNAYWMKQYHAVAGTTCSHSAYTSDGSLLAKDWLESLKLAAQWLSKLSKTYPHLVGFTVDDFTYSQDVVAEYDDKLDERYTAPQVAGLMSAAKTCLDSSGTNLCNASFKFWPTLYFGAQMAETVSPGYTIGQAEGTRSTTGDWLAVNFEFSLDKIPSEFSLSYFYKDQFAGFEPVYKDRVYHVVKLNGTEISKEDIWGSDDIEGKDLAIDTELLNIGTNTISLGLYVNNNISGSYASGEGNGLLYMHKRHLNVWGVNFKQDGLPFTSYTTSSSLPTGNLGSFAKSNADYLLTSSVDGVLAPLPVESVNFEKTVFNNLLSEAKSALGSKDLIVVPYGQLTPFNISPTILMNQIRSIQKIANGVAVWNPPLEIWQMDPEKGIFAERKMTGTYDTRAYWAGYNNGLPGWYESWKLPEATGEIVVKLYDEETGGTDGADELYFVKTITDSEDREYYRDGTLGTECDAKATAASEKNCPGYTEGLAGSCKVSCAVGSSSETVTINLGEEKTNIKIAYELTSGVGGMGAGMQIDLGSNPELWDFESGVTNKCHIDTYDAMKEAYKINPATAKPGKPSATATYGSGTATSTSASLMDSLYSTDSDGDGISDCADPQPKESNIFWIINKDLFSECITEEADVEYGYEAGKKDPKVIGEVESGDPLVTGILLPGLLDPSKAEDFIGCSTTRGSGSGEPFPDYGIFIELND